jgi:hypothetical protein
LSHSIFGETFRVWGLIDANPKAILFTCENSLMGNNETVIEDFENFKA